VVSPLCPGTGGRGGVGLRGSGCCARHGVATLLSSAWLVLVAVATVAIKVAAMAAGKSQVMTPSVVF